MEQTPTTSVGCDTNIILSSVAEQSIIPCVKSNDVSLLVSLKAPFFEDSHRAPVDIVTVIDRSGSMEGTKINLVKDTLKFVVRQLQSNDRLSIVVYDHETTIAYPLTKMDLSGKDKANDAISLITARGSTDLCEGLLTGMNVILQRTEGKNEVASVLLFTDGHANAGIQNVDAIVTEMSKKAAVPTPSAPLGSLPCSVHTFGFGADHDAHILKSIADRGSGTYFFVENKDTIADAFADCLGGLLSVVAQNISLEVSGVNGSVIDKVKTSYATIKDASHYTIALGDIQSEEERDIMFIVSLPEFEPIDNLAVVHTKLSYFNVITSKQEEKTCDCLISRNSDLTGCVYDLKVDRQRNRLLAADALTQAKKKGDAGDYVGAREVIDTVREAILKSKTPTDPFVLGLLKDLDISYAGLHDRQTYTSYGGQTVTSYTSAHCQQRATHATPVYQTAARGTMKSKIDK